MKILLIGNKGQVGRELHELAIREQITVFGYDIAELDIVDRGAVADVVAEHSDVEVIINAAAYTAVDKAEDEVELAYAVNSNGVENIALAAKRYDIPLLHISTDYVFSGDMANAYSEESETGPINVYGKSKLEGEKKLQIVWSKSMVVRISWVFGKYGSNFVKTILRLAQERDELGVVADQWGCPTPAADISRVLLLLAKKIVAGQAKWGIYHFCGKPVVNWYEFASEIISLAQKNHTLKLKKLNKLTTADYPTRAKRPANSVLEVTKITKDYGIEQHSWQDYLAKVVEEVMQ